ncbi:MAG TPA: hypothetical protein PKX07_02580, partial [Aggregatilineales bacterium]|nr:hypothetical protein [Aggregatilineales bacterium]
LISGWLRTAAELNPITYILGAMRTILNEGWVAEPIVQGLIATSVLGLFLFAFAAAGLRARARRK